MDKTSHFDDFAILIAGIAATFRQEPTEPLLEAYWLGLQDLPFRAVKAAASRALRQCRFLPSVAELRELAGEAKPEDRALLAWEAFERAVETHGGYASVAFDDPAITATCRSLGGWERCCSTPTEEFDKWLRKDFLTTYAAICRTGVSEDAARPLIGIHDRQNAASGYREHLSTPTLVRTRLPALPGAQPKIERTKPDVTHAARIED